MAMTSNDVQNARFRSPKKSGLYVASDVDDFLEQVAEAFDDLHTQLAEAEDAYAQATKELDEARRAPVVKSVESPAAAAPSSNVSDELSRTLLLAQRAADLARQEAEADADKLRQQAESDADRIRTEARKDADALLAETQGALRADVTRLESARAALQTDVDNLQSYVDAERQRLRAGLSELLGALESGVPALGPRPTVHEIELPSDSDTDRIGGGSVRGGGSGGSGSGSVRTSGSSMSGGTTRSTSTDSGAPRAVKVNLASPTGPQASTPTSATGRAGAPTALATAEIVDTLWVDEIDDAMIEERGAAQTPTAKQDSARVVDIEGQPVDTTPSMQMYLSDLRSLNDDDEAAKDPTGEVFMRSPEEEERRLRQMTSNKRFARRKRG
jgi:DivIVA domain-containing protein